MKLVTYIDARGNTMEAMPLATFRDNDKTFAVIPRGLGLYDTGAPYAVIEISKG